MRPPNFGDVKIKAGDCRESITSDHFSILENHKLHKIIDRYKALYIISIIFIKYNTIKSYYAKSAMREKKG